MSYFYSRAYIEPGIREIGLSMGIVAYFYNTQGLAAKSLLSVSQINYALSDTVVASFIAGGVAGAVSRTIVSPLERLKILFQVQSVGRNEYKLSVWKALVKIGKEEGWRGYMRGNGTNCIRIVPYSAVQFGSYSVYKKVSHQGSSGHGFDIR
jgi:hypothetical protein